MEGEVIDLEALIRTPVTGDDGSVTNQRIVDTGIGDQVGLELVEIHVQRTIKSQTGGNRADDLGNQAVQVIVAGTGNVEFTTADVVDSLIIDQEGAVRVLDGAVSGEDRVVRLNHGSGDTRSRVDGKLQLGLLSIVGRETLQQKRTKTGTGTTTEGVEDQEALQRRAVVYRMSKERPRLSKDRSRFHTSNTTNTVNDTVNKFLSDGVVSTGVCSPLVSTLFFSFELVLPLSPYSCWRHPPFR